VALAERLLGERAADYVPVVRALGLFRKRRGTEGTSSVDGAPRGPDPLLDIASQLRQARAAWAAGLEESAREE
jgi:hypothetical protein